MKKAKLWIKRKADWFNKLCLIVKNYDLDRIHMSKRIREAVKVIRERTDIHADIHYKSSSSVIVVGKYNGRDYVQCYNLADRDFAEMIGQLRQMEKYGYIGRIDRPPTMDACFEHEKY